jgi:ribosomal-protein-alanine N-acetyltransferase
VSQPPSTPSSPAGSASPASLRPATEDDVAQIAAIEAKVHKAPWGADEIRAELNKPYGHFMVLTDDETDSVIQGYIVFWLMFDECNILNVAVDLPYRGLGLAKRMIQATVGAAMRKNIRKILLDVRKSNLPAIQLYQAQNFVITHIRKSFYSDGEDAYQMALFLQEQDGDANGGSGPLPRL